MGLLDDAIREHLELKRRHGADAEDVARQEREALGAPARGEFAQPQGESAVPPQAPDAPDAPAEPLTPEQAEDAAGYEEEPWAADALEATEVHDIEPEPAAPSPPPAAPEAAPVPPVPPPHEPEPRAEAAEEPDPDDVLGETPDFLQETPEHDRLWFEQKPPRDFDWDN